MGSLLLEQNVKRPAKSPSSANGLKGKKGMPSSASGRRAAAVEAAAAEELGLTGHEFEGLGIGTL